MSKIVFYEKPGCLNQARQKSALQAAGHELVVRDLIATPWCAETLRPFFGDRPVPDWFNRAAPQVKSGEIVPETLDPEEALALMMADPLLIRRPLMLLDRQSVCGFDEISQRILWISTGQEDYAINDQTQSESCSQSSPCSNPGGVTESRGGALRSATRVCDRAPEGSAHHEESRHDT